MDGRLRAGRLDDARLLLLDGPDDTDADGAREAGGDGGREDNMGARVTGATRSLLALLPEVTVVCDGGAATTIPLEVGLT